MCPASRASEAREATQQGALAGAIRAEQRHDLAGPRVQLDVERERAEGTDDVGVEAHAAGGAPPPRNRSRKATSTAKDTAISTRLRTIASSGSISFVR